MLIRGIYGVVYSTIIIGMFRYIIIIIYEVPTRHSEITADHFTAWVLFLSIDASRTLLDSGFRILDSGFNAVDSGVFVSGTWIPDSSCSGFRIQRAVFYY